MMFNTHIHTQRDMYVYMEGKPEKSIPEMQFHVRLSNQPHNNFVAAKTGPESKD